MKIFKHVMMLLSLFCVGALYTALLRPADPVPLTIMVHGTSTTTNYARWIPPLYKFLSRILRSPHGLIKASALEEDHAFREIAQILSTTDPRQFSFEDFYFFGWSGDLSSTARKEASQDLYKAIQTLLKKSRYQASPVTIITHSHGGNIALYLAEEALESRNSRVPIDRLVLLACPVQDITEPYIASPLFNNVDIYHLYSSGDMVQMMDPQGFQRGLKELFLTDLFSRREFAQAPHIFQAQIQKRKRKLSHLDFIKPEFYKELPAILDVLGHEPCRKLIPKTETGTYLINLETFDATACIRQKAINTCEIT